MENNCKYFIQIDSSSGYQSELIEISKEAFETEYARCLETVDSNKEDYYMDKRVDEFDDKIETEYTFGLKYTDIFLMEIKYKN